jgi:signal peptidase II
MNKKILIFIIILISTIIIDQYVKDIFVNGFIKHFDCMSFFLVYNKGVAFSMFSNFTEYLKYVQMTLLFGLFVYLFYEKTLLKEQYISWAFILGGGIGNIIDRFYHIGVVDFIYFHCGFNFAIFVEDIHPGLS